jgi:glycosyltransferase involved in cell wall biosynthesis
MKKSDRLRIAQLTPYYHPSIGGVETVVKYISEELVHRGHEVEVMTTRRDHKGEKHIQRPDCEIINGVKVRRFRSIVNLGHMSLFPGIIPALFLGAFDIIQMHSIRQPQTLIAPPIARFRKAKTILQGHTHFKSSEKKTRLYEKFDKLIFPLIYKKLTALAAITNYEKQELIKKGISKDKVWIIPNAINDEYFAEVNYSNFLDKYSLRNKKIILFIGHLLESKGVDLLLKSLPKIVKYEKDAILLLIGPDNGRYPYYEKMARELNINHYFKWLGRVSEIEKRQALASMNFLALPSHYEAFGLVLIEAMAAGKPVIAASSPGPDEIINNGSNGFIIKKDSEEEFVDLSIKLLKNDRMNYEIGKNAKSICKTNYSLSSVIDKWEQLYYHSIKKG